MHQHHNSKDVNLAIDSSVIQRNEQDYVKFEIPIVYIDIINERSDRLLERLKQVKGDLEASDTIDPNLLSLEDIPTYVRNNLLNRRSINIAILACSALEGHILNNDHNFNTRRGFYCTILTLFESALLFAAISLYEENKPDENAIRGLEYIKNKLAQTSPQYHEILELAR